MFNIHNNSVVKKILKNVYNYLFELLLRFFFFFLLEGENFFFLYSIPYGTFVSLSNRVIIWANTYVKRACTHKRRLPRKTYTFFFENTKFNSPLGDVDVYLYFFSCLQMFSYYFVYLGTFFFAFAAFFV